MNERNCDKIKRMEKTISALQERIEAQNKEMIRLHRAPEDAKEQLRESVRVMNAQMLSIALEYGSQKDNDGREISFAMPDVAIMDAYDLLVSVDEESRRIHLLAAAKQ